MISTHSTTPVSARWRSSLGASFALFTFVTVFQFAVPATASETDETSTTTKQSDDATANENDSASESSSDSESAPHSDNSESGDSDSGDSDSEGADESDDDVPPAASPERRRARQRAQMSAMSGNADYLVQEWALDISLEGGIGTHDDQTVLMGRGMIGPMYISEPHALSLLATADIQHNTGFSAGGLFQYLSLHTGLFFQAGSVVNLAGEPGVIVSGGWQIAGFEFQRRNLGGNESNVFLGKLRIPVTWLWRAFQRNNDASSGSN